MVQPGVQFHVRNSSYKLKLLINDSMSMYISFGHSHWPGSPRPVTFPASHHITALLVQILSQILKFVRFIWNPGTFLDLGYFEILAIDIEICVAPFPKRKEWFKILAYHFLAGSATFMTHWSMIMQNVSLLNLLIEWPINQFYR